MNDFSELLLEWIKEGPPHLEFYLALLAFFGAALGALILVLDAFKALNGTDDEESVVVHATLAFFTSSSLLLFLYLNIALGIVTLASYLLSLASFGIYLMTLKSYQFESEKENIVVRVPFLHEFLERLSKTKAQLDALTTLFFLPLFLPLEISKVIKLLFKGDSKLNVFMRYLVISGILVVLAAGAYPVLGTFILFLAEYSVSGYLSLLATLVGALMTVKSVLSGSSTAPQFLEALHLTPIEYLLIKVAFASALTAFTIYGLRNKVFAWGPGAAVVVFPMLSVFFIEKSQEPLGSLAYALGALVSLLLNKRRKLEEMMDRLLSKMSLLGEKILRLEVPIEPTCLPLLC